MKLIRLILFHSTCKTVWIGMVILYGCIGLGCESRTTKNTNPGAFQKIDYSDPNYSKMLAHSTKDTLLKSGYSIEYFVVDSSKYDDIYIVWGKGLPKDTLLAASFLTVDDYEFIPVIRSETDTYLILDFDCAQEDCTGSIFLNKTHGKGGQIFQGVLWHSKSQHVVIFNEGLYSAGMDSLYIYDLEKNMRRTIPFEQERIFDSADCDRDYIRLYTRSAQKSDEQFTQIIKRKN